MRQASYSLTVTTHGKGLTDITEYVEANVRDSGIANGLATLFCRHTSASLLIQEKCGAGGAPGPRSLFRADRPRRRTL